MKLDTRVRFARPTDRLDEVVAFYRDGLGLDEIGGFRDHQGFDGVMLGIPGEVWHLELTHKRGHAVGRAPSEDHLIVFYLSDLNIWQAAVDRLRALGHAPVVSFNPYWDANGVTFEDPDGYRVVLARRASPV
jgi:catechol 2,3-dioxygenase-like lactoylglutathione lyase family enzyme